MNKLLLLSLCLMFSTFSTFAQEDEQVGRQLTLDEIVLLAKDQSPAALQAETRKQNRYWAYRSYQADFRPQLYLSGNLPSFRRTVSPIVQPNGTVAFRRLNQNQSQLNLGVSQVIGRTGGRVFVETEMQRFDNFQTDEVSYSGNPAVIGFSQQLFGFNPFKWDKIIAPLRYEESIKGYVEDMEDISVVSTRLFFDVLLAQINQELAEKNLANNDTIYQISQGRYNLGKIGENDLLRVEYNVMRSRQEAAQARLDLETSTLRLRSFIGLNDTQPLVLMLPGSIPQFEVDEQLAISEALQNHPNGVQFERRIKEAERDVARERGDTGLNAQLEATYGLTDRGDVLMDLYNNPENQQQLGLSFFIPVVNWGRQKARVKTQEALFKLTQYEVAQERVNFEQEVYTQVKTFKMLRDQVELTRVANDIAARKYEITKQRYLVGQITITDFILALQEKDQARRDYLSSLEDFWINFYDLRRLTLYDFSQDRSLLTEEMLAE